jgi:hypothetical protein
MKKYCALIIETRPYPDLYEIIQDKHMKFLPKEWELKMYSSRNNAIALSGKFCDGYDGVIEVIPDLTISDYNKLLTSLHFWEQLCSRYDRVLIFQTDSSLLRQGINEFLQDGADYYGAPWSWQSWGGNGGLSLRNPKVMCDVIKKFPYNPDKHGNEDVYFSNHIEQVGGRLGSREMNSKFSVEAVFALGSFGQHAPEKWLSKEQCEEIKNQYNGK